MNAGLAVVAAAAPKVWMYQACISFCGPKKCRWCETIGEVWAFNSSSSTFTSSGPST